MSKNIRLGVLAIKRLVEEEKMDIRLSVDDGIRELLSPEERKCLDAFLDYHARYIQWIASEEADTEGHATQQTEAAPLSGA